MKRPKNIHEASQLYNGYAYPGDAAPPLPAAMLVIVLQISEYDLVREGFDCVRTTVGMIGCGNEEHQ